MATASISHPRPGVPREELLRLMGLDDSQYQEASCLQYLLSTLKQQREEDIDEEDVKGRRTGYFYAAHSMFRFTFGTAMRPFYDTKRKNLWYLGWKVSLCGLAFCARNTNHFSQGPKVREDPELEVRSTYYILQKSRYLCLYRKAEKQLVAKFDMQDPEHRKAFVDVRRSTAERFPPIPPKHRDLQRIQRLHNRGNKRRARKELVRGERRFAPSEDG